MQDSAVFKFNGGNGALLCSGCSKIIKTGYQFTEEEKKAMRGDLKLKPRYCDECKGKRDRDALEVFSPL